ncbi:MAG: DNA polymerase III subunit delta [Verrucomicrobiota bacterium]
MAEARYTYISGPDDYLVSRLAKAHWSRLEAEVSDDFSKEVISGHAAKVDEVSDAVNRFRDACQTMGLFGGKRVVWLKGVSFLADNQTGRAEGTLTLCDDLKEILERINPDEVGVLITASPVDRRRSFPKWLEKNGDYHFGGGVDAKGKGIETLVQVVKDECEAMGVTIGMQAMQILIDKVNANSRLLIEETRKLATYLGDEGSEIESKLIEELVPNFGEGDFFETTEAFFSRNIRWTIDALRRHFFAGHDARPVISSLQNRNRLLIQLKALADGGEIALGSRGINKAGFENAASKYAAYYGGLDAKSGFNVFTQNLWYMGKLMGEGRLPTLKKLIDHQQEFIKAFEEIVERPNEQEEALRNMAIRCLA